MKINPVSQNISFTLKKNNKNMIQPLAVREQPKQISFKQVLRETEQKDGTQTEPTQKAQMQPIQQTQPKNPIVFKGHWPQYNQPQKLNFIA